MTEPHKILIVEDDPNTAEMLRAYFETQGYQVLVAAWGNEAIEVCQDTVPDLVIEDIRLPDIDGYQVVHELRKHTRTSNVPIIFLTERQAHDDRIAGLRLGAVAYLSKPFDMQELDLRVRNALRRASYTSLVSPITGLPVRQVTEEWLGQIVNQDGWAIIYVSVCNVESFSESYGFVAGDDVLRAVGLIIGHVVDEIGTLDDQVGHIGQEGFVLVTQESRVDEMRDALTGRLSKAFNYFYPIRDLQTGQVAEPMRVEIGVTTASAGPFVHPDSMIAAVTSACQTIAVYPVAES
jgi:PleD family two-component response regulator